MVPEHPHDPRDGSVLACMWLDGADDIARARRLVADAAAGIGLRPDRVDRLTVALSEVATNAVVHGGGAARVRVTAGRGELAVEVRDGGSGLRPTSVGVPVPPNRLSGRGLWLAGQLCDGVDVRPSDTGTTVRLTMRLRTETAMHREQSEPGSASG